MYVAIRICNTIAKSRCDGGSDGGVRNESLHTSLPLAYCNIWDAIIGEEVGCVREPHNERIDML